MGARLQLRDDGAAAAKGKIRTSCYMNNSRRTRRARSAHWQGFRNRSVANMLIDLGQRVSLTDDQFQAEMARRRGSHLTRNDNVIGALSARASASIAARPANSGQQHSSSNTVEGMSPR